MVNTQRTLLVPVQIWQGLLDKRGTSPEEKGWILTRETSRGNHLALFRLLEVVGSETQVTSDPAFNDMIGEVTARHRDIGVCGYHTHPIEGPSSGDLRNYSLIYEGTQGQICDFFTIGPNTMELNRVYPMENTPTDLHERIGRRVHGRYVAPNIAGTQYARVLNYGSTQWARHTEEAKPIALEAHTTLQRLRR